VNNYESMRLKKSLVFENSIVKVLDFGMHAYADTFLSPKDLRFSEPIFPLSVVLDPISGLLHNEFLTPDIDRYNKVDYSYTSSNSNSSRKHLASFVPFINSLGGKAGSSVVEVGSNDGYLCSLLMDSGYVVNGVDISESMARQATKNGITTFNKLFGLSAAKELVDLIGECDFLIANNVFNHANDPLDFLLGVKSFLKDNGLFVIEVPYWKNQIENNRFDMVYHEHISYFTVLGIHTIVEAAGMYIRDIQVVDSHGGSLRIVGSKFKSENSDVNTMIDNEKTSGLFTPEYYSGAIKRINRVRAQTMNKIYEIGDDEEIFGIGAAAKANTLLTYFGLNSSLISAVTDSSPLKIGKYTPLTRIPIVPDDSLSNHSSAWAMILSWNLSTDLRKSLSKINPTLRYIEI
jgi:SAM-dependent methyltransferase